jgi:hypothetical protein
VAFGLLDRLRGLIGRQPSPLLIPASSVHGFHLTVELVVVALDRTGAVVALRRLRPWRVIRVPQAQWMLELPPHHPLPGVGDRLQLLARSGESDS